MACRLSSLPRRLPAVVGPARCGRTNSKKHVDCSRRYASTSATPADPKTRANALIDALPGNSVISKTGIVTLGTALTGLAISSELYVVNEESIVLGGFVLLAGYIASAVRAPYREWADGQIEKISGILNATRADHTQAVKTRIDSVGEMSDVVGTTKQLFSMSRDTAKAEHEAFQLRQKVALAAEIKTTLDSWVRFEAAQRSSEQQELVKSVIEKVLASLQDQKTQKDILSSAVADIEQLVKDKKV